MTIYEYIKDLTLEEMALFISNLEWYLYVYDADTTGDNLKRTIVILEKLKKEHTDFKNMLERIPDIVESLESELVD